MRREMCMSVTGHAGYAPRGQDIVCAGASTLFHTMIEALENESVKSGGCVVYDNSVVRFSGGDADRVQLIMDTVWTGFQMLAEAYGEYITTKKTG